MLRRILKRPFVRNVAILTSGNTIAQALTIAASPILTRLYSPDEFGSFGLLTALSGTLVVISGLRYELAVVTTKDDATAANLLILSCGIVLLVSGMAAGLVATAADWIGALVERPDFAILLWWLPILTAGGGIYQAMNYWAIRRKLYQRIAVSKVAQAVASVGLQLTAGAASLGATGLVGGRMLGSFLGSSLLTAQILRADRGLLFSAMKLSEISKAAKDNANFPKYNAPHDFVNSLSRASIPYTFAPFFGVEIVGFYYLADRVLNTPSVLVSGSIRRVFFQRASELHNQGRSFHRLLSKTLAGLFAIAILPFLLLLLFAPDLFSFAFGSEWRKAGVFVQWLAMWWFLAFLAGPTVEALIILQLQKYLLLFRITFSLMRVLSIIAGAMIGDEITAIAACSIVGLAFNFGLIVAALIVVQQKNTIRRSTN